MSDEIDGEVGKSECGDCTIPPVLRRWTATLLSRSAHRLRAKFESRVEPMGLRSKHYGVLILLQDGPMTQVEIGRNLWVDRTTMVAIIDDMTRLNFVERARHPDDRRAYAVTLTQSGREALKQAIQTVNEVEAEVFAPLSMEEREQLRILLQKIL
jgi:DNA-binding MarR family transcriptional regulator